LEEITLNSRLSKFREALKEKNIEAALICKPENRRYLSGFTGSAGYVLITAEKAYFITDFRYIEQAKQECIGYEIIEHHQKQPLFTILNDLRLENLGFEEKYTTYSEYMELQKKLTKTKLFPLGEITERLRIIKDPEEIDLIRKAASIADEAFQHICHYIKPGLTEKEIAIELEMLMKKKGASALSFEPIVASGIRSALPHGVATDKKLEKGDLLTLDFGCIYNGYCSDMTRTVILGKANQKQKEVYDIVLHAQMSALESVRPHILSKEVDKIARDIITQKGYGDHFGHGLGHGVGLEIHEAPRVSPSGEEQLEQNMVITVEPGIYVPGFGGIRIEDLVVITEKGKEILSKSSKQLIEL